MYQIGHKSWVLSIAWSPDGKTLASGSMDNTVCGCCSKKKDRHFLLICRIGAVMGPENRKIPR